MTNVSHDEMPPPPDDHYGNVTQLHRPQANPEAEHALITTVLRYPEAAPDLLELLNPDDFHDTNHETIWATYQTVLAQGLLPDAIVVNDHLPTHRRPRLDTYLGDTTTPTLPSQADYYADLIRTAAIARRATAAAHRAHLQLQTATDLSTIGNALADGMDALETATRVLHGLPATNTIQVPTIGELLAGDDEDYDWVIPGLIEHQERVILTAEEGAGKSTLLRQIAVCAATGINPFTLETIAPVRVLHVDVENSIKQSRRQYGPLHAAAGQGLDDELLRIQIRIQGLDLTTAEDVDWLAAAVRSTTPDLIVIGPIYKLANGDPTEEASSKPVAMALDRIRAESGAAMILEAHVKHATGASKKRPHEPYGWSGWMRWPEIGIFLGKDGKLTHWRGAREERSWPTELTRGGTWPWTARPSDADARWETIRNARLTKRSPMSLRELAAATGMSTTNISRIVGNGGSHGHIWPSYNRNVHPGDDPR